MQTTLHFRIMSNRNKYHSDCQGSNVNETWYVLWILQTIYVKKPLHYVEVLMRIKFSLEHHNVFRFS